MRSLWIVRFSDVGYYLPCETVSGITKVCNLLRERIFINDSEPEMFVYSNCEADILKWTMEYCRMRLLKFVGKYIDVRSILLMYCILLPVIIEMWPCRPSHQWDVIINEMWLSMRCDHKWDVIINEMWSSMRCDHQWDVIINEMWSSMRCHHQWDVIINEMRSPVRCDHQWDVITNEMWSPMRCDHQWDVITNEMWSPMRCDHQWDVIIDEMWSSMRNIKIKKIVHYHINIIACIAKDLCMTLVDLTKIV